MSCAAEMCPNWTGDGCICAVFGLDQPVEQDEQDEPND